MKATQCPSCQIIVDLAEVQPGAGAACPGCGLALLMAEPPPLPPSLSSAVPAQPRRGLMFYAIVGAGVIVAGFGVALAIVAATKLPKLLNNDSFQMGLGAAIIGIISAAVWIVVLWISFYWLILPFTLAKKLDEQTRLLTQIRDSLAARTPPR